MQTQNNRILTLEMTNLSRYSLFEKLINVTCFVFHFLENFSGKIKKQNQCLKKIRCL